nr:hypothetical protein [Alicyclobacillus fastidiosus]
MHTVVTRPSDRSYGIQVAKLAGLPPHVVRRAQALLEARESAGADSALALAAATSEVRERPVEESGGGAANGKERAQTSPELALFDGPYRSFAEAVAAENLLSMTPLQAMNRLNELIEKARELL